MASGAQDSARPLRERAPRLILVGVLGVLCCASPAARSQEQQDAPPPRRQVQVEVLRQVPELDLEQVRRALREVERRLVHLTIYPSDEPDSETRFCSGFLLNEGGEVVTIAPALQPARRVVVRFLAAPELAPRRADILGVDQASGIGMVRVGDVSGPQGPLGAQAFKMAVPDAGMPVFSLGARTEVLAPWASLGQFQSRVEGFQFRGTQYPELLQVSVQGPSRGEGGLVARPDGQLIGVILSRLQDGGAEQTAIALTVPMGRVLEGVGRIRLRTTGAIPSRSERPWLGMVCLTLVDPALRYHLQVDGGVIVHETMHASPAVTAGLRRHDVLLRWNDVAITDSDQFQHLVGVAHPGDEVRLEVIRQGEAQQVELTLGHW